MSDGATCQEPTADMLLPRTRNGDLKPLVLAWKRATNDDTTYYGFDTLETIQQSTLSVDPQEATSARGSFESATSVSQHTKSACTSSCCTSAPHSPCSINHVRNFSNSVSAGCCSASDTLVGMPALPRAGLFTEGSKPPSLCSWPACVLSETSSRSAPVRHTRTPALQTPDNKLHLLTAKNTQASAHGMHSGWSWVAAREQYQRSQSAFTVCGSVDESSDEDMEEETKRITGAYRSQMRLPGSWLSRSFSIGQRLDALQPTCPSKELQSGLIATAEVTQLNQVPSTRASYLTQGQAAVELFLRLNHARQTVDFVRRQATLFASLDIASLTIWEALDLLNELREYETPLMEDTPVELSLLEHAHQTAERCRLAYPELDWLHLVGLIHALGKLLAHRRFGSQPQWAVCGESFPVGCRFASDITGSQYFTANPDRRRRLYNTQHGMYEHGCGLRNVSMSWSGAEYLEMVLSLNGAKLPDEAMFLIRYHKFHSLLRPNGSYHHLLCEQDNDCLQLLKEFQQLSAYRRVQLPASALTGDAFHAYYDGLIKKYLGSDPLAW